MNTIPANSSFRKPVTKPAERITPHQVLALSNKFGGKDHDLLITLKNQMTDDIRQRVELRRLILIDAPKAELLKVIEEAK